MPSNFSIKGPTAGWDFNSYSGVQSRSLNKKRKSRLPYHAKRHLQLPVMGKQDACLHSQSRHEELVGTNGKPVMVSYALPCQVNHKPTTKSPQHKDTLGRKWK
jgi:hypothetical protein